MAWYETFLMKTISRSMRAALRLNEPGEKWASSAVR